MFIGARVLIASGIVIAAAIGASRADAQAPAFDAVETVTGSATAEDGDTLCVAGRRVRLASVDAPETRQLCERADGTPWPCGREATAAAEALIAGRPVTCRAWSGDPQDSRGRMVGICTVAGRDVGLMLLERGLGIAVPRYTDGRPWAAAYRAAEAQAKVGAVGMWSGRFISPSTWRSERFGNGRPMTPAQRRDYGAC